MTVELITGFAGTPHINSSDAGAYNAGLVGPGDYALATGDQLKATMSNATTFALQSGDAVLNGRHVHLTGTTTATVGAGVAGQKRNDIAALRYTRDTTTNIETVQLVIIKGTATTGTPADPTHNKGLITDGVSVHDMPLYRIPINGIIPGTLVPLFNVLKPMSDVWDSLSPVGFDAGTSDYAWRFPGRKIAWGFVHITWKPNQPGNTAPIVRLPFKASRWDLLHVQLQLSNDRGDKVDGFNQIAVIPSDVTLESFKIRSWNASNLNLSYRVAWSAMCMD